METMGAPQCRVDDDSGGFVIMLCHIH
jgi:hypothetical protein